jgi:hypothetical protein
VVKKKKTEEKKQLHQKPDLQRTVSSRASGDSQHCKMKLIVFQSYDNRWHLHKKSQLEHSFHAELDDKAKVLGEKDLEPSDVQLVRLCFLSFFP